MKSVKNIQKITKAMKMVAASKLRAIQAKAENSRGLWQPFTALLGDTPSVQVKKDVIVTFSSDEGLCGGINSTSVKISNALNKLNSGPDKETKYVILGEKAKAQLIRGSKKDIELCLTELPKNSLNYTQIVERESESGGRLGELDSYEIEGGETKSEILQNLAEFQFSCVSLSFEVRDLIFRADALCVFLRGNASVFVVVFGCVMFNAVLENACSEQGARMSALDSSSRNAGEMLDRLTLTYNRPPLPLPLNTLKYPNRNSSSIDHHRID
ncbi:hypothetical protein ACE6H2_020281 [Prunus campanulata]